MILVAILCTLLLGVWFLFLIAYSLDGISRSLQWFVDLERDPVRTKEKPL